jgi:hypothetical protein
METVYMDSTCKQSREFCDALGEEVPFIPLPMALIHLLFDLEYQIANRVTSQIK